MTPPDLRIAYLTSHPMTVRLKLADQLEFMRSRGYDVHAITADGHDLDQIKQEGKIQLHCIPFQREISPWKDFRALLALIQQLRDLRPTIVNASTPKAGLLGMLAAWLTGVPIRIYTQRGLRHETMSGTGRLILKMMERVSAACATEIICVSHGLRQRYLAEGFCKPDKIKVLGPGSSNGLNAAQFDFGDRFQETRLQAREDLDIPHDAPVIGFVGRFTRDKGFEELVEVFQHIIQDLPAARLLLVGDFEEGDPVPETTQRWLLAHPHVALVPFVKNPARFFTAMDVLAFPSHREGFPVVPLEAAAAGVPTVAFRCTGSTDAIVDGQTGAVIAMGDVHAFARAVRQYLTDEALRAAHGAAAQRRVKTEFKPRRIWQLIADEYTQQLRQHGLPAPAARPCVSVLGVGEQTLDILHALAANGFEIGGLYDDDPEKIGTRVGDTPVVGKLMELEAGTPALMASGNPLARRKLVADVEADWLTLIDASANVDPTASLGEGSVVLAGCQVAAGARIGRHVVVGAGSVVERDAVVEDFVVVGNGTRIPAGVVVEADEGVRRQESIR